MGALLDDPMFVLVRTVFDPADGSPVDADRDLPAVDVLKFRYRFDYESLCRKVTDSIT
jgi:hypothetical protein